MFSHIILKAVLIILMVRRGSLFKTDYNALKIQRKCNPFRNTASVPKNYTKRTKR